MIRFAGSPLWQRQQQSRRCPRPFRRAACRRRPVTSVPAADVEGAVVDQIQKLLATPELVARTWASTKREDEDEITEREVTILLTDFAMVWSELFPAEQARIVQLLVERVDLQEKAIEVRIRAEGLASLVGELRHQDERKAA
jgi:site-specific DNA recombinase